MDPFPKGHNALVAAGYIYGSESICKREGCGYKIRWYRQPSGSFIAVDKDSQGPHWKVCIGEREHRRKKAKPAPPPEPQMNMFEREPR